MFFVSVDVPAFVLTTQQSTVNNDIHASQAAVAPSVVGALRFIYRMRRSVQGPR